MGTSAVKAVSVAVLLALKDIEPSQLPPQIERRKHFKESDLTELAASIKTQGLIQPIVVRPGKKKKYELVAGERRFLAHGVAKLTHIEAIVRDLDDEQTVEVQLQENLQRMEVEPLDEAFSYKWLIEHSTVTEQGVSRPFTVADIAAKFGRSESIILRRMQLNKLVPAAIKDLADGNLPLAHAELIARFPEHEQTALLKDSQGVYRYGRKEDGAVPYKQLREHVESRYLRLLHGAPFDPKDPVLHPQGLRCGDCKERTGFTPQLFDDGVANKDACLNGKCFKAKTVAFIKIERVKIASDYPNPKNVPIEKLAEKVPLLKSYWHTNIGPGTYVDDDYNLGKAGSLKECDSVEKAISVKDDSLGRVVLICRNKKCKKHNRYSSSSSSGPSDYALKEKEAGTYVKAAEQVRKEIIPQYIATFTAKDLDSPELRRRMLAQLLYSRSYTFTEEAKKLDESILPKALRSSMGGYSSDKIDKIYAVLAKLTPDQEARVAAMAVYLTFCEQSAYSKCDQAPIQAIAKKLKVNYDVKVAEARVASAPTDELKKAALAHVEKLRAGKPSKAPSYHWPKPKKVATKKIPTAKAKAAAK